MLIGLWSRTKIKTVVDYFTTGGRIDPVETDDLDRQADRRRRLTRIRGTMFRATEPKLLLRSL